MAMYVFMLFPYQAVKHQTIAYYYLPGWMWTTDPKTDYRPSVVHLIGITMKKGSKGKNINDCKRLGGLLILLPDGFVAAE